MKGGNHRIRFRPRQGSEQTWRDAAEAIAHMREALELIGYHHALKQLAREALKRFDSAMKESK
jgi:hypothetical protein